MKETTKLNQKLIALVAMLTLCIIFPLSNPKLVSAEENVAKGTPAPIVYINDKGQAEIHVKFYLQDNEDGEDFPVKNLQFATCAFIEIPGIPIPVHFYNFDDLTGKGANPPSQYFYNLDNGISKMPILLGEEGFPLLDFAQDANMEKTSIAIYKSRGFASEGRNYIKDDDTWFQIDINFSDDKKSIESYQLYRMDTNNQKLIPIDEKDFAFYNKVKTLPLSVEADLSLLDAADNEKQALKEGDFEFALLDENDKEISRAKNRSDGKIVFPAIKFFDEEEHKYSIKQIIDPNKENIIYDETVYKIEAQAKEQWSNDFVPPEFKSKKYFSADQEVEKISFTNKVKRANIHFDSNGGSGKMEDVKVNLGDPYKLPANTFIAPDGKVFDKWEIDSNSYDVGASITVNSDITVKAIWKDKSETIDPTQPENPKDPDDSKPNSSKSTNSTSHKNTIFFSKGKEEILEDLRYIYGYPEGTLKAEGQITRAEVMAIIARGEKYELNDSSKPNYKDAEENAWYNKYVNACTKAGILKEKEGDNLRAEEAITRAELADIISRITSKNDKKSDFTDIQGHWAEGAINQGFGNKILTGYPDKSFKPDNTITRAETVVIINALYNRYPDKNYIDENQDKIKTYTDLDKNHWAYYEIIEASESHKYVKIGDHSEEWKELIK